MEWNSVVLLLLMQSRVWSVVGGGVIFLDLTVPLGLIWRHFM